jgi:hypothetical protein
LGDAGVRRQCKDEFSSERIGSRKRTEGANLSNSLKRSGGAKRD